MATRSARPSYSSQLLHLRAERAGQRAAVAIERAVVAMERFADSYAMLRDPCPKAPLGATLCDHVFYLEVDRGAPAYTLGGFRHGAFSDLDALEADLLARLRRWQTHALALGGWVWRRTCREVIVTLPGHVPVQGRVTTPPWAAAEP